MQTSIKYEGIDELKQSLTDLQREQFPFAMARALTKVAQNTRASEYLSMRRVFARTTTYVLNSLYIRPCLKTAIEKGAEVGFKDYMGGGTDKRGANIVEPHAAGGERNTKAFETALRRTLGLGNDVYITPGPSCQLDQYGNIPSSLIVKILSYLKAFDDETRTPGRGWRMNITDKKKARLAKGSKKHVGYEYFVSYGPGTLGGRQNLPAGIYHRFNFKAWGSSIKLIMKFTKKPHYKKRFPFEETAQEIFNRDFQNTFNESLNDTLKTAK